MLFQKFIYKKILIDKRFNGQLLKKIEYQAMLRLSVKLQIQ